MSMLNFTLVNIHNFLSIGKITLPLNGTVGLTAVYGTTKDSHSSSSNGAGKSSLFEAVLWCIYGETSRGVSHDSVLNIYQNSKDCVVAVSFQKDGSDYKVLRGRKHKEFQNGLFIFKDGEDISARKIADTQEIVLDVIGMSKTLFQYIVVLGQGMPCRIGDLTDTQLKTLLDELLGADRFDVARDRVRAELREAQESLQTTRSQQENCETLVCEMEETLKGVEKALLPVADAPPMEEIEKNLKAMESIVIDLKDESDNLQRASTVFDTRIQHSALAKRNIDDAIVEKETRIKILTEEIVTLASIPGTNMEMVDLRAAVQQHQKWQEELMADVEGFGNDVTKQGILLKNEEQRIVKLEGDAKLAYTETARKTVELNHRIADRISLNRGHCNTCGQDLPENSELLEECDTAISLLTEGKDDYQLRENKLKDELGGARKSQEDYVLALRIDEQELHASEELLRDCGQALSVKEKGLQEKSDNIQRKKALPELKKQVEELSSAVKNHLVGRKELEDKEYKDNFDRHTIDKKIDVAREKLVETEKHQVELSSARWRAETAKELREQKAYYEDRNAAYHNDIVGYAKLTETLEEQVPLLEFWAEGFSVRGVRALLMQSVLDDLNFNLDRYCFELFDGELQVQFLAETELKSGKLSDRISKVIRSNGVSKSYASLSGGERRRVDLALHLALRDTLSEWSSIRCNLLVADEVLDQLDDVASEKAIRLLSTWAGATKSTAFIVSHTREMQALIPRALEVVKENGVTSLCPLT